MTQVTIDQAMRLAIQHHQAGRTAEAEKIYRQVLTQQPNHADALHLLGIITQQPDLIRRAIAINPTVADYHNNLATVLRDKGSRDESIAALREAVRLKGDYADAHYNLGVAFREKGLLDEAIAAFRNVIRLKPNFAEAHNNLGNALLKKGSLDEAIVACRAALHLKPDYADAHFNLGNALRGKGVLDESIASLRQAARLAPDLAEVHHDLGNALREKGLFDEAIVALRQAIHLKPDFFEAYNNLGNALRDANRLDEAITAYRHAVMLKPDLAEAHHNLSVADLLKGDFHEGWREYEWRWRCRNFISPRREFVQRLWDGAELNGQTILLHAEQGFGDTIQFVRYAPLVAKRGGKVVLQCQIPLLQLMVGIPGVEQMIAANQATPPFAVHCPLLSLPGAFDTRLETIPATIPYLHADTNLSQQWAARTACADKLKVGIVWAGAAGHSNDRNRSLPLRTLGPLSKIIGIRFFSLQKGEAAKQAMTPPPGMDLIDHSAGLNDFADTAALIANLDLVLAADTAVAHLAGAIGKPVWVLLPFAPDWRWLTNRSDSPWYPTMHLFRQEKSGDWAGVIERVAEALGEFSPTSQARSHPKSP